MFSKPISVIQTSRFIVHEKQKRDISYFFFRIIFLVLKMRVSKCSNSECERPKHTCLKYIPSRKIMRNGKAWKFQDEQQVFLYSSESYVDPPLILSLFRQIYSFPSWFNQLLSNAMWNTNRMIQFMRCQTESKQLQLKKNDHMAFFSWKLMPNPLPIYQKLKHNPLLRNPTAINLMFGLILPSIQLLACHSSTHNNLNAIKKASPDC